MELIVYQCQSGFGINGKHHEGGYAMGRLRLYSWAGSVTYISQFSQLTKAGGNQPFGHIPQIVESLSVATHKSKLLLQSLRMHTSQQIGQSQPDGCCLDSAGTTDSPVKTARCVSSRCPPAAALRSGTADGMHETFSRGSPERHCHPE